MIDIEPIIGFKKTLDLPGLKQNSKLEGMPLLQKGQRLSVQPVPPKYFDEICKIAGINQATM
jgi:predicted RNA-binding protein with PUA-like domain